jgi:hypothetical protein
MIVLSEVNASIYAKGTTPALDPVELSVEEEAQGFARRLKTLQGGERQFNVSKVHAELRILLKNQERGYSGWEFRIAVLRRTLELVRVAV